MAIRWEPVPIDDLSATNMFLLDGTPIRRVLCPCGIQPGVLAQGKCPNCGVYYRIGPTGSIDRGRLIDQPTDQKQSDILGAILILAAAFFVVAFSGRKS